MEISNITHQEISDDFNFLDSIHNISNTPIYSMNDIEVILSSQTTDVVITLLKEIIQLWFRVCHLDFSKHPNKAKIREIQEKYNI